MTAQYPSANTYYIAYFDFLSQSAQAIPSNAYLEYDEFIPIDSADFSGGIDLDGGIGNLRDFVANGSYIRDENDLRAHPFSDQSAYAKGQWYHRKFDMGAAAGGRDHQGSLPGHRHGQLEQRRALEPGGQLQRLFRQHQVHQRLRRHACWTSSATPPT